MSGSVTVRAAARRVTVAVKAVSGAAASMLQGGQSESWTSSAFPRERIAHELQDAAGNLFGFFNGAGRFFLQHIYLRGEIDGPLIQAGQLALGRSQAATVRPHNQQVAAMSEGLIVVIGYGQSLMAAQVGEPGIRFTTDDPQAVSTAARMLGASTRPQGTQENAFWPIGVTRASFASTMATYVAAVAAGSTNPLGPLQATTLNRDTIRTAVLSQPTVEGIVSGTDDYEGHDPVTSFTDHVARRLLVRNPFAAQQVVGVNAAAGGRTYEQLSKTPVAPADVSDGRWKRMTDARDIAGALGTALGKTAAVGAVSLVGGQFNYNKFDDDDDGTAYQNSSYPYAELTGTWAQSADAVEALVQQLGYDMQADLMCSGQALPPAIFVDQPSGRFTRDNARLGVGMGTLNAILKNRNRGFFGAHSDYAFPDWGGHMMANGYRWRGVQIGKVMARVLVDRLDWDVFAPYLVETSGNRVYVHYSPPVPPIRQTRYFGSNGSSELADDWGCRIEKTPDAGDWLSLDDFRVLDGCILSFRCSEAPGGSAVLWQGDEDVHKGGTNIADSDETTIEQVYTVTSWMTLEGAGDLADLVGRRYPLQNFAWCGYFPMGWERPETLS